MSPSEVADTTFDLQAVRERARGVPAPQAKAMFEGAAANLEKALFLMLRAGRSAAEMEEAERDGIHIVDERVLYLVLSSSEGFAGEVVLELVRLIRWIFDKRFTGEPYTLHLLVLLPDLFLGHGEPDYATTYALLKRLDHATATKIQLTPTQQIEPFDTCWLMDGRNARAVEIGTMDKNLASYVDAFAGFLTSEPERSGALAGTLRSRGKVAAYNSFGHGELFFPAEITITRLSATLASDIIRRAFLAPGAPPADNRRKLLLAVKQFVLSKDFERYFAGLEQSQGAVIWQGFKPKAELNEKLPQEFIAELQRLHKDFERESLLAFRNALLARSHEVQRELTGLIDAEIDRRADAAPNGLGETIEFLKLLTEPAVALEADLLGEHPKNLLTEHSAVQASLDERLEVTIDHETTVTLLDQIHNLRGLLSTLRTNLRLLPLPAGALEEEVSTASKDPLVRTSEEDRQGLLAEIADTEEQLQALCTAYRRAVDEENRMADQSRRDAQRKAREVKAAGVDSGEANLLSLGRQLREAQQTLADLRQQRREFLRRYLLFIPFITAVLLFGLPLLASLGDIGFASELVDFVSRNFSSFSLFLLFCVVIYLAAISWEYKTGINRQFKEAGERAKALGNGLAAAAVQLNRAHNDQLRLDYELYAQNFRAETVAHLIESARRSSDALRDTLTSLREARAEFDRLRSEAAPSISIMRRSVISAGDLDAYYHKKVPDAEPEANTFTREHVARSQVRRLTSDEFRAKLTGFVRRRFDRLADLSIEDVLLREADLVSSTNALQRLRELSDISEPLLRLRETDTSNPNFAQRDMTLWAAAEERDRILELFRKIQPETSVRACEDQRTLRVLSRCLNFPAHFIGPIEHYRACYDRAPEREAEDLPDLLPVNSEVRRAHEQLLLALVFGTVARRDKGDYALVSRPERTLGTARRLIAESLAADFTFQKLYAELRSGLETNLSDHQQVYNKLSEWRVQSTDLDSLERELLDGLVQKYHPLR